MKKTVRPVRKKKVPATHTRSAELAKRVSELEAMVSTMKSARAIERCNVPITFGLGRNSQQCGNYAEFEMPKARGALACICRQHAHEMDRAMKPFGFHGAFRIEFIRLGSGEKVTF